jgi:hypothetical protein
MNRRGGASGDKDRPATPTAPRDAEIRKVQHERIWRSRPGRRPAGEDLLRQAPALDGSQLHATTTTNVSALVIRTRRWRERMMESRMADQRNEQEPTSEAAQSQVPGSTMVCWLGVWDYQIMKQNIVLTIQSFLSSGRHLSDPYSIYPATSHNVLGSSHHPQTPAHGVRKHNQRFL